MNIFILANGGEKIGMGHIMRTLVLAKELRRDLNVKYVCSIENEFLEGRKKVIDEKFDVIDEKLILEEIKEKDILIIDRYDLEEKFLKEINKKNIFILIFDDNNLFAEYTGDLILNQNIHSEILNYNLNKCTKLLSGGKYALLRSEFLRSKKIKINEKIKDIMITVGGSDNCNLTYEILKEIEELDINLHVIIGVAFKYEKMLKEKFKFKKKIYFYKNAIISEIMERCDICISACGSTIYELCYLGIPTIGLIVATNQELLGEYLKEKNIVLISDIKDIKENIKKLKCEKRNELNIKMKNLIDGKGKKRVVDEIINRYNEKFNS